jgi:hypothetical protein
MNINTVYIVFLLCHVAVFTNNQIYVFKFVNTKRKMLYCNANIHFNKECLAKKIVPDYAKINLKPVNDAAKIGFLPVVYKVLMFCYFNGFYSF